MCGIIGVWAPDHEPNCALDALKLSAQLRRVQNQHRGVEERESRRLIGRWAWPDHSPRWGEVRDCLGDSITHALRALAHRGPDGAGFYLSPCRSLWLAHTRLAIRGTRGAQPIGASRDLKRWSAEVTEPVRYHL